MAKLNLLLLAAFAFVAIVLVTSEHRARSLNTALDEAATRIHLLEAEYAKLQIDASLLSVSERVATIAIGTLKMRQPERRVLEVRAPASRGAVGVMPAPPMPGVQAAR